MILQQEDNDLFYICLVRPLREKATELKGMKERIDGAKRLAKE